MILFVHFSTQEMLMKILPEIELDDSKHLVIQDLRNASFHDSMVKRSYFKQLPHYRLLKYEGSVLIGYAGIDYRAIRVGREIYKILGVMDMCVRADKRGQRIGILILNELTDFSKNKDVDFILLISDNDKFYVSNGFHQVKEANSWLRIDEHKNYGVAFEFLDDLYVKPVGNKEWATGHVDWLGYMF
jgi:predicted N-acetyltransferase YhbS